MLSKSAGTTLTLSTFQTGGGGISTIKGDEKTIISARILVSLHRVSMHCVGWRLVFEPPKMVRYDWHLFDT